MHFFKWRSLLLRGGGVQSHMGPKANNLLPPWTAPPQRLLLSDSGQDFDQVTPNAELNCTSAWRLDIRQTAEFTVLSPSCFTLVWWSFSEMFPFMSDIIIVCYLNLLNNVKQVGETCRTLRNQEGAKTWNDFWCTGSHAEILSDFFAFKINVCISKLIQECNQTQILLIIAHHGTLIL